MKTFKNSAAQGDLLIMKIDEIPSGVVEKEAEDGKIIVAHSETGHSHYIKAAEARFYGDADPMVCYLQVDVSATLIHNRSFDTHEPLTIPAGNYVMKRQREWTPEGWRKVED